MEKCVLGIRIGFMNFRAGCIMRITINNNNDAYRDMRCSGLCARVMVNCVRSRLGLATIPQITNGTLTFITIIIIIDVIGSCLFIRKEIEVHLDSTLTLLCLSYCNVSQIPPFDIGH